MAAKLALLALAVTAVLVACSSFTEADPDKQPVPDASSIDAADDALTDASAADAPPDDPAESGLIGCQGARDCERVVFLTSSVHTGSELHGTDGADGLCNLRASTSTNARVKGRTFRAWLSTSASAVSARLAQGTKPYVKPDGISLIASSWTDFASDAHMAAIDVDENGVPVPPTAGIWTGSNDNGASVGGADCADWSASGMDVSGEQGSFSTGSSWSAEGTRDCTNPGHLYCIEY